MDSDSSRGTAKPRGRPFPKGVSGNPGGRPKGVAARVRALLEKEDPDDPSAPGDVWEWFDLVRRGKVDGFGARERLDAAKTLVDRGYGRAPETQIQIQADAEQIEGATELASDALTTLADHLQEDSGSIGGTLAVNHPLTPEKH